MIEASQLTKQRGARTVVSDVTFRCEPGTVTGFLGPNGAGKTTTMRMLVGLSEPDSGHAQILGGPYRDLPNPGRRVGILLDASAQHAGRRGREALAVSAHTMGVPAQRVEALLELVGLSEPDRGDARILGVHYRDLPNPGRRVGILLDASAQHPGRRGKEALAVSAHTMGVRAQRVDAVLELVGLDATAARRRVGEYSLGMR